MQEMFSKMGMGGLFSKRNMNQAMSKMNQTMGQQSTKNRLRRKLEQRKANVAAAASTSTECSNHLEKKETKWRPDESEPIQKTMKVSADGEEATKKKKRKKKKKTKN
jgi:hypothetical protein